MYVTGVNRRLQACAECFQTARYCHANIELVRHSSSSGATCEAGLNICARPVSHIAIKLWSATGVNLRPLILHSLYK